MSKFFSVSTSATILLDDSTISSSTGWSSEHILDEINTSMVGLVSDDDLNALKVELNNKIDMLEGSISGGGGSGLEYREVIFTIHLNANETKNYDYLLEFNTYIITNLYFNSSSGNFSFQINNKNTNGFKVYDIQSISNYMDTLFLTYNDNDFEKKLRMVLTNKSNFPTDVTISIFGMLLKNS